LDAALEALNVKLGKMKRDIQRLEDAIEFITAERDGLDNPKNDSIPLFQVDGEVHIARNEFRDMTIGQAAACYLRKVDQAVKTGNIVDALIYGGIVSTAKGKKLRNSLRSSINSAKENGTVYRKVISDGFTENVWALIK